MVQDSKRAGIRLPQMTPLQGQIFALINEINPQSLYVMGLEDQGDRIFIPSAENLKYALRRVRELKERLSRKDVLEKKFLDSIENQLEWDEPSPDIGMVSEILGNHLIKEGVKPERLKVLLDQLSTSLEASIAKFRGREYPTAIRILTQYQILGANELLDILEKETKDQEFLERISRLRKLVSEYRRRFEVEGFTDGSFEQVIGLMKKHGPYLGREVFYPKALKYGFDYSETPKQLERLAISWIDQELPRMRSAIKSLSKIFVCDSNPESVDKVLRSKLGVGTSDALRLTLRIRPVVQAFVNESIVGINPGYNTTVLETPSYLTPIIPTGAAQGYDSLTDHPSQRFYLTTDPKRAPPGGFADLVNLLVHEEYGHCVHFSNTALSSAPGPGIIELLPSLHAGSTSEGLAFQRELEFLDALKVLGKKLPGKYTEAEEKYVRLTEEFGGLKQTSLEIEFITFRQRIIRFLRVVGDSRINSGRQNLLEFLEWAEKRTGLLQRSVFFQIFPAHEGIYPGYATCYAVVGQEIRKIQKPFKNDREKMVKFNAYACSIGYPARSVYSSRLKEFARTLTHGRKRRKAGRRGRLNRRKN